MSVCFHRLAAPGQLVLFAMGGTAYLALEIAWRGTTHWTMFLAGGACLCALDALGRLPLPTPLLAGIGAVGVSVLELGTGLACRRLLHVEVWDYSQEWGQPCRACVPKIHGTLVPFVPVGAGYDALFARFCRLCGPHKGLKYTLSPCFFVCDDWKSGLSPWMSAIIKP